MDQVTQERSENVLLRQDLRKQESEAKLVPYMSFIFTHAALVLFLVVAFLVDRIIPNSTDSLILKVILAVTAIILLAIEWTYAIISSRRWKRNIQLLHGFEEKQRLMLIEEEQRRNLEILALEQMKSRTLKNDLQRLRGQQRLEAYQQSNSQQLPFTPSPYTYTSQNTYQGTPPTQDQSSARGRDAYKNWKRMQKRDAHNLI